MPEEDRPFSQSRVGAYNSLLSFVGKTPLGDVIARLITYNSLLSFVKEGDDGGDSQRPARDLQFSVEFCRHGCSSAPRCNCHEPYNSLLSFVSPQEWRPMAGYHGQAYNSLLSFVGRLRGGAAINSSKLTILC